MQKRVNTDSAPAAIGPYSQAVSWGDLVFCSGQIPLDPKSMTVQAEGIQAQTMQVLQNLNQVLLAAGSSPAKVLKTTVFVTDLGKFTELNKVYEDFFKTAGVTVPPARSTVEVKALPKGVLVEIEAIAFR